VLLQRLTAPGKASRDQRMEIKLRSRNGHREARRTLRLRTGVMAGIPGHCLGHRHRTGVYVWTVPFSGSARNRLLTAEISR